MHYAKPNCFEKTKECEGKTFFKKLEYNVRVFMSGFAFRKTCIKHIVSKVRMGFERWLVVFNKKEKRVACVGY